MTTSDLSRASVRDIKNPLLLAILTTLFLIPFVNKAFHIDDPLFIWVAQQIHQKPLDFFGFELNWTWTETPVAEFNQNPPGVSYYIAIVASLFGWSEVALHLAFIPVAIGVILGTYRLAKRMCRFPFWAASITLFSPVFLISSTLVMCDTMLLCAWVWAVVLWVEAFDSDRRMFHWAAGLLMAFALLIKFPGINLVPLLFVYGLFRSRGIGWWCLPLLLPIAALIGYEWYTSTMYGVSAFRSAATFATDHRDTLNRPYMKQCIISLMFTGGCYLPVLFYQPWIWNRVSLASVLALLAISVFGVSVLGKIDSSLWSLNGPWSFIIERAIHFVSGITILALCVEDVRTHRNCDSLLLVLWILGVFTFTWVVNWTINGRTLLPMAPAVSLLLVRRISEQQGVLKLDNRWPLRFAITSMAAFALLSASADYVLANSARTAAADLTKRYGQREGTLWSQGHWGFQYYAELAGAKTFDRSRSHIRKGEILLVPRNNLYVMYLDHTQIDETILHEYPVIPFFSVWSRDVRAAFYWDGYGSLPFAFGKVPPEKYTVWVVNTEIKPRTRR